LATSIDELERLIRLCREGNVRAVKFGDVELRFAPAFPLPADDDGDEQPPDDEPYWAASGTIPKSLKERRGQ
jgi:hypothetical protein